MHKQTLAENTERVLKKIAESGISEGFYLAGGTALALELGHRKSEDLDWFSAKPFSNDQIKKKLSDLGEFELTSEEYGYEMLYPFVDFENTNLADERDIAAMKIDAVSSRGSRKDFVDIYFLLKKYSILALIGFFEQKYKNIQFNKLHIFKSLVFFEDAEAEPMPVMIRKADWEAVKQKIQTATNSILGSQS